MPAKSEQQQKLMAQAYEVKKFLADNTTGIDPDTLDPAYKEQIVDLANSMSLKSLKDFAETKHDAIPKKKVKENLSGFLSAGTFPRYYVYAANIAPMLGFAQRDKQDRQIKKFVDFTIKEAVAAVVPTGVPATTNNTSGVGNIVIPKPGENGSGDIFTDKIGIMKYDDYKKWLVKYKKKQNIK